LTKEQWERIKGLLPLERAGKRGRPYGATAKQKPHLPQHIFIAGPYIRISAKLPALGLFISLLTAIFANNPAKNQLVIIPPIGYSLH
jgi:hypothetical protein